MNAVLESLGSTAPRLGSHLVSSTLFLIAILVVLLVTRHRWTAAARFSIAMTGIAKFAVPASLVAGMLERSGTPLPRGSLAGLELPRQLAAGALDLEPGTPVGLNAMGTVVAISLAVTLLILLRQALTRRRLVEHALRAALPPRPRELEALAAARRRLGIRRSIDLIRSGAAEAPAVLRTLRPLIVLPVTVCDELSDGELEALLAHECVHVARQDNLLARIESLLCAFFWFHPLLWITRRITSIERERACDEQVTGSDVERDLYLAALTRFCHAAVAPRLPGVSCMATSTLKERMDHVMHYPMLRSHAPSARRITAAAAAALVVFTLGAALVSVSARASTEDSYATRVRAVRSGETVRVELTIVDNRTEELVAAPRLVIPDGGEARTTASGAGVSVDVRARPDGEWILVEGTLRKEGEEVQAIRARIRPELDQPAEPEGTFSGQPLNLSLENADLREVLGMFGEITGLQVRIDDSVQGKVSVHWQDVPWDKAFSELLGEQGLTYTIEGSTIHVRRK